jgi:hypothetical protein
VTWSRFLWPLVLLATACQPPVANALTAWQSSTSALAGDPNAVILDQLTAARRLARTAGLPDFRDGVERLAAAWEQPTVPGGVELLIEPTRFDEALSPVSSPLRVVRLWPRFHEGEVTYLLRIDSTRYFHTISGPAELALYLYAASLRREWYEAKRARGLHGQALLDALITDPQGLLAAQYSSWGRVIDQGYLPLRRAGLLPALPHLEVLAEGRASCPRTSAPERCWQERVRSVLTLRGP